MTESTTPQVTATTLSSAAVSSSAPPPQPRLRLRPDQSGPTVLDGGWWPRSSHPATELPGLILAIDERHGPITSIMLGRAGWDDTHPRRLHVDSLSGHRTVRLGWFETMPAGLLTAISRTGRTDLLTVPPHTSEPAALAVMKQAAQADNRTPSPVLLASVATTAVPGPAPASVGPDGSELSTWDWEGGQDTPAASRRPIESRRTTRTPSAVMPA